MGGGRRIPNSPCIICCSNEKLYIHGRRGNYHLRPEKIGATVFSMIAALEIIQELGSFLKVVGI